MPIVETHGTGLAVPVLSDEVVLTVLTVLITLEFGTSCSEHVVYVLCLKRTTLYAIHVT